MRRFGTSFNPALGGEGSEYFHRMYRSGARYLWCDTAVVHESISMDKFKLRYLAVHAFRTGQTRACMTLAGYGMLQKMRWSVGRASALAASLLGAAVCWPMGRSLGVWALQQVCSSLGQLSVLADQRFKVLLVNRASR